MAEDEVDGVAVVLDEEPVADVLAVAVDGDGALLKSAEEGEGDELFGELVGAVVVRAVRDREGEAVGVGVGASEVVAAGLRGGVGRAGVVGGGLGEGPVVAQAAEDLVGGDVVEAVGLDVRLAGLSSKPRLPRRLQERRRADDVRLHELERVGDGAVDVALGGEVDDGGEPVLLEETSGEVGVGDVALDERVVRGGLDVRQVGRVAGVGEPVEVDEADVRVAQHHPEEEVRADKAGPARDEHAGRAVAERWRFGHGGGERISGPSIKGAPFQGFRRGARPEAARAFAFPRRAHLLLVAR